MKKVISALLVAVLVFSMIPITVSAIGTAVFSLNVVEETNDKVTVVVNLDSGEFKAVDFKVKGTSDKIGSCVYVIETDDFLEFLKTVKRSGGSGTSGGNSDNGLFGAAVTTAYKGGSIAEYTFKKNSSGKVTSEDLALTVTSCESTLGKITVTTEWHESSYMISYNPNGGSVSPTSEMVEYNKSVKLPSPTRKGYNCLGWANSGSASKADYACGASYTVKDKTTLYAVWQANTYTVVFYATDGNVNVDKKTVTYDSAYGTLPVPTRPGYTFTGWFTEPNGGTEITADKKVAITANQTLYAHWTANTYTVTLDANGGSCSTDKITVTYNSAYSSLPNPTRTGYSFDGWYTAKEGGSQVTSGAKVTITSNQTLYAHWNADVYIITLDANGGSSLIKSKTVSYNSTYGTLPTATRTGYSFDGWYTEADGGTKVTSSSKLVKSGSHTLYAHWSASKYTVSFNGNGGNASSSSKSVTYNSTYGTLPTASRTGYTFDGWYTAKDGGNKVTEDTKFTSTSNQTLYAHWKANTYTVSFNLNGGSGSADSKTVSYGSTYGTLPTVSRTGYGFDGWYTDANGGTKITSDTKVAITSNQTLYAHWKLNTYTVSFNGNGGNASSSSKSVTYNSTYGTLPTATRTGYTFDGWYTEANGGTKVTADTKVAITSNQTLYAHWTINVYTVTYNANGGSVSTSSAKVEHGKSVTLPTPTRPGYTCRGWSTNSSDQGASFACGASYSPTSNITLYAVWRKNVSAPVVTTSNIAETGKIKVSWNAVDDAVSYNVYRATKRDGIYTLKKNTASTSYINTSTKVGKSYYYKVQAVAKDGTLSEFSEVVVRTCDLPRPVVTGSNIASTGKIKLTWEAIEGAVSYKIYRSTTKDGSYNLMKTTTSTSYINTSAAAGTTYYYKVKAVAEKSAANSAYSKIVTRTCDCARPVVTATNVASTGKVKLSWDAVDGAVSYNVYRATSKNGTYAFLKNTTSTTLTNTSTVAGVTYYYKVKAVASNTAGNSAESKIVTRTCDLASPKVTTSLTSSGKPKLTWNTVDGAVSYKVYRSTSENGTYTLMKTTTSTTYTNTSAVKGTTYYYRVKAVCSNSAGDSAYAVVKAG